MYLIFLSMHSNPTYAVRALRCGALGYVLKEVEILQAIENALLDIRYPCRCKKNDALEILLAREREMLQLIAKGHTHTVIADKLSLSVRDLTAGSYAMVFTGESW
jgi:DNA-binding NarL/FixJ family response regulator